MTCMDARVPRLHGCKEAVNRKNINLDYQEMSRLMARNFLRR
jgi:hypothetical protein